MLKEYLEEELKFSALKTRMKYLVINDWQPVVNVMLLAAFPFALAFIFFLHKISQKFRSSGSLLPSDHAAFRALLSVSTPTSVSRPSDLRCFLEPTRTRNLLRLEINLFKLLDGILAGQLELRDPSDIRYLIKGQLRASGWYVEFYTGTRWSIKVMKWIAKEQFLPNRQAYIDNTCKQPREESIYIEQCSFFAIIKANPSLSYEPRLIVNHRFPYFDLDFVRYVDLKAEVGRIQRVRTRPGSTVTIEFSCLATDVGFSTKYFMLCAVPFVPRRLKKMQVDRTPTALLVRTGDVISLFSTGPLVMESFTNISHEHASFLQLKEEEFVNSAYIRQKCIRDLGKAGWREEIFMLNFEASLLLSGLLTRWRLILRK
ncbi:hypothetical protein CPB84DRAFT_1761004 [Gymnopilus junonius]|uniref:Uncharacterized protein n=1 Tax=Gymnopilus junonius TaxID=109634 RepID=A0A9P5NWU3_GYMJU|nr:hypothetical protein CPB84DRAFT_1761004 [Gymnopilus junonius]